MTPRIEQALTRIRQAQIGKDRIIVAIDGPCASGKSTLAYDLSKILNCPVIHMDDFFLRPEQRTPERLDEPGGNLDRERFMDEVLLPLTEGKDFTYSPFLCKTMTFGAPITVISAPVTIVEGSYSCHPALRDAYDLRLLLTVSANKQERRLLAREGSKKLAVFRKKWIPMEEKYLAECCVTDCCDILPE